MMSAKIKGEKVFLDLSLSCLGRTMVASFLSISGRLRWPSLAPNVLYVIRKYAVGIAIIHRSVFPFTDIAS